MGRTVFLWLFKDFWVRETMNRQATMDWRIKQQQWSGCRKTSQHLAGTPIVLQFSDRVQGAYLSTIISSPNSQKVKCNVTFCQIKIKNAVFIMRNVARKKEEILGRYRRQTTGWIPRVVSGEVQGSTCYRRATELPLLEVVDSSASTYRLKTSSISSNEYWANVTNKCFQDG